MHVTARSITVPWLLQLLSRGGARPFFLGVSGPQGGGKSTLCAALVEDLRARGHAAVTLSVDDFYLPRAQQVALAEAHPGNRFLEHRGYPGTHDVDLGTRTLHALAQGLPVALPRYDKSAHGGRGDRAPEATWTRVDGRVDVVLLEGWMLGFAPVDESTLPDAALVPANRALHAYRAWHAFLHAMVLMCAEDPRAVAEWRVGAERARRAAGQASLTEEEARDYVERFLPAYATWLPGLERDLRGYPAWLRMTLATDRSVTGTTHG